MEERTYNLCIGISVFSLIGVLLVGTVYLCSVGLINLFDGNIVNTVISYFTSETHFISDFPDAVFSSMIALYGIFFAAILIVFSLDYLSRNILMKYSFYKWQTYTYISYFIITHR